MMTAIAIDDELPALKVISRFCSQVETVNLLGTFHKPGEALAFAEKTPVDLLFLDIQMPSQTGIELYKAMPPGTLVIFTTAFSHYAVEGFTLRAIDYLLKPFTLDRFKQATDKAFEYFSFRSVSGEILLKAEYGQFRVPLAEIGLIEASDDYVRIHLEGRKPLMVRTTLKTILAQLPTADFVRVHRSYIVPLRRIENVRNKTIFTGGREIPLGGSYEQDFLARFLR